MINERIWMVNKRNNYQDCRDEVGRPIRRNFPEVIISEVYYSSPLDLALKLNGIKDLEDRLNKDYVYTDYDLALEEAKRLKEDI